MFISNTKKDKKEMLKTIGVDSFECLLQDIPKKLLNTKMNLPKPLNEMDLVSHIQTQANKNKKVLNFLGAGAYEHFIPSAINAIATRGEFITAYTPYQAEASQGTLQAIYEYQSAICSLFDMHSSNASLYDGATAVCEAVNACVRANGKKKILLSKTLHPHYIETVNTYLANTDIEIVLVDFDNGQVDIKDLETKLDDATSCFVFASPNFLGVLEDGESLQQKVHAKNALLVSVVNPISLGVVATPGSYQADICVAEGQPLGNGMNYGGPHLGIFACKKELVRQIPGRVCGIAKDKEGNRSFVLTLQAREQHIRRERAASNICSNQALCALNAVIYLILLGPEGMKEVGEVNLEKSHKLKDQICQLNGFELKYDAPFFNEFVIKCPKPAQQISDELAKQGILVGYPLNKFDKSLENCLLICATETKSEKDLQTLVNASGGLK